MGAMKWFLMGVEELINPNKTLEENVTTNINNKVEVRGEKFELLKMTSNMHMGELCRKEN